MCVSVTANRSLHPSTCVTIGGVHSVCPLLPTVLYTRQHVAQPVSVTTLKLKRKTGSEARNYATAEVVPIIHCLPRTE